MYNIFDLKEMDQDQLRALASELNVKGFKKMEKDDLVYAILDADAIKSAQNAPEKPAKKCGSMNPSAQSRSASAARRLMTSSPPEGSVPREARFSRSSQSCTMMRSFSQISSPNFARSSVSEVCR